MKYKLFFVTFCKIIFVSLALGGCAGPETSRPPGKDDLRRRGSDDYAE